MSTLVIQYEKITDKTKMKELREKFSPSLCVQLNHTNYSNRYVMPKPVYKIDNTYYFDNEVDSIVCLGNIGNLTLDAVYNCITTEIRLKEYRRTELSDLLEDYAYLINNALKAPLPDVSVVTELVNRWGNTLAEFNELKQGE